MSIKEEVTQSQKISNMINPFSDVLNPASMLTLFNRVEFLIEDAKKEAKKFEEGKEKIAYVDHHGDVCLSEKEEVRICVGSQHRIIIDKLFGPTCVRDLKIVWEGDDWNVRNKIRQLKSQVEKGK